MWMKGWSGQQKSLNNVFVYRKTVGMSQLGFNKDFLS